MSYDNKFTIQSSNNYIYSDGNNNNVCLIGSIKVNNKSDKPSNVIITNSNNQIFYTEGSSPGKIINKLEVNNANTNIINSNNTITCITKEEAQGKTNKVVKNVMPKVNPGPQIAQPQTNRKVLNSIDTLDTHTTSLIDCFVTKYDNYTMIETPTEYFKKARWGTQSSTIAHHNATDQQLATMEIGENFFKLGAMQMHGITAPSVYVNGMRFAIPKTEKPISTNQQKCLILDGLQIETLIVHEPLTILLRKGSKINAIQGQHEVSQFSV